jgi:hypothetical protein
MGPVGASDPTRPSPSGGSSPGDYTNQTSGNTTATYTASTGNMATPDLYPGSPDFRYPAFGSNAGTGSTAPSLLSSFFTLPIKRLSEISANISNSSLSSPTTPLVPYVTRFNDWGNSKLNPSGTNANDFLFNANPGGYAPNQLLSRNDFEALMLQYRMRGATSYMLFQPGITGYSEAQEQSDAATGWNQLQILGFDSGGAAYGFGGSNPVVVTTATNNVTFTGSNTLHDIEQAGVVWSGIYNSISGKMAILVSNLSPATVRVSLPSVLEGGNMPATFGITGAGALLPTDTNRLLLFTKSGGTWNLDQNMYVFTNTALNDHTGTGIPEPASVSLLSMAVAGVLVRRRRKK